jgi:hypothetical protein
MNNRGIVATHTVVLCILMLGSTLIVGIQKTVNRDTKQEIDANTKAIEKMNESIDKLYNLHSATSFRPDRRPAEEGEISAPAREAYQYDLELAKGQSRLWAFTGDGVSFRTVQDKKCQFVRPVGDEQIEDVFPDRDLVFRIKSARNADQSNTWPTECLSIEYEIENTSPVKIRTARVIRPPAFDGGQYRPGCRDQHGNTYDLVIPRQYQFANRSLTDIELRPGQKATEQVLFKSVIPGHRAIAVFPVTVRGKSLQNNYSDRLADYSCDQAVWAIVSVTGAKPKTFSEQDEDEKLERKKKGPPPEKMDKAIDFDAPEPQVVALKPAPLEYRYPAQRVAYAQVPLMIPRQQVIVPHQTFDYVRPPAPKKSLIQSRPGILRLYP